MSPIDSTAVEGVEESLCLCEIDLGVLIIIWIKRKTEMQFLSNVFCCNYITTLIQGEQIKKYKEAFNSKFHTK